MKRFLVFTALVPPLALVIFNAPDVVMHHDFKLLDPMTFGLTYTITVIPAWILAAVDWKLRNIAGTTIAGAAIAYLAAFGIGFPFMGVPATLMIGLTGGIPAAACSWLSNMTPRHVSAGDLPVHDRNGEIGSPTRTWVAATKAQAAATTISIKPMRPE
jgi:hypothetical protein